MTIEEEKGQLEEFRNHVESTKDLLLIDTAKNKTLSIKLNDKELEINFHADAYVSLMYLLDDLIQQADELVK